MSQCPEDFHQLLLSLYQHGLIILSDGGLPRMKREVETECNRSIIVSIREMLKLRGWYWQNLMEKKTIGERDSFFQEVVRLVTVSQEDLRVYAPPWYARKIALTTDLTSNDIYTLIALEILNPWPEDKKGGER